MTSPTLDRITLYPVKSLDGVDVEEARVLPSGTLEFDCPGGSAFPAASDVVRYNEASLGDLEARTCLVLNASRLTRR